MLIGRRLNDYQANKRTHFVRWDAYSRGGFAIMPHMSAPVIEKLGASMTFKPPFFEQILELALTMTSEPSKKVYWEAHNKLRDICETHKNSTLDHPFQWETLADFTIDSGEQLTAYFVALELAQKYELLEYIESVATEVSEIYLSQSDKGHALTYSKIAKDAKLGMQSEKVNSRIV